MLGLNNMDKATFEDLMYKEWKQNTLDRYSRYLKYPYFDLVWELRNNLYDIFYPLGISTNGIHDVASVVGEISYAFEDDGELSIVAAYTEDPSFSKTTLEILEKVYEKIGKPVPTFKPTFNYFVCQGDPYEINSDNKYWLKTISDHALLHKRSDILISYKAKHFNIDGLKFLHSLIPRFEKERELAKNNDNNNYYNYRKETNSIVEEFILSA
jgi:hypothetical protein